MIFYFSGTGNSLYAAKLLGEKLREPLMDIAGICQDNAPYFQYTLAENEKLGFVFPIYAWQPPAVVKEFLKKLKLRGSISPYTFGVCTMGGNAGQAMDIFRDWLRKKGLTLHSGYSVEMPDNYVVLFEVEDRDEEAKKLSHADFMLNKIAKAVIRERKNFFPVKRGGLAKLKSYVINPIFQTFSRNTKAFYVTGECIGCGQCKAVCTSGCIHMKDDRPVWDKGRCNMCLACLNRCPKHAVQYGKRTESRGRYVHPSLR